MKSRWFSTGRLIGLSLLVLVACDKGSDSNDGNNNNNNDPNPGAATNSVSITNMSFRPARITVKAGTEVTWTNNENMAHTVTASDGGFGSNTLQQGNTYKYTFTTAGSYPYYCDLHYGMNGTVIVE